MVMASVMFAMMLLLAMVRVVGWWWLRCFKYHGHVLEQLEHAPAEDDPRPRPLTRLGIAAKLSDFVFAAEESHGVLVTADIRDKDAAGAALLLAELAAVLKADGRTIVDYLDETYGRGA